jgi:hypothetical protein
MEDPKTYTENGGERLRLDIPPELAEQVDREVADFIALRNRRVAENIGKDD